MTALFTKNIKKQFMKRKFKPNFQRKDPKEYVCYQCNKKGHFAKNCPNGSGEERQENKVSQENTFSRNKFQKKQALVATWGSDSEEDPETPHSLQDRCLMERSNAGSATSKVASNDLSNSLNDLSKNQLIKIIKELGKENGELQGRITEYEDEVSCFTTENAHWSKKVENLELALTEAKRTNAENKNLHAKSSKICASCKGKSFVNELENRSFWSMLEKIISKLDDLTDSIDDKTVNQTVFVKPRYGLGYYDPSEFDTEEQAEHEKIRVELVEKMRA